MSNARLYERLYRHIGAVGGLGLLAALAVQACTHAAVTLDDASSPSAQLAADPSPDDVPTEPQYCNTNGLKGAALQQCKAQNDAINSAFDATEREREPWFNFAPEGWAEAKLVANSLVHNVVREDLALPRLETAAAVELTAKEAQELTGKNLALKGLQPYLLRGLRYAKQEGSFAVYAKAESIYVRFDAIGDETASEAHTALVVYLASKPKDVYVECQIVDSGSN